MPTTRVDPHVKVLNDEVAERAKAAGIDVLVYAPHFTRLPNIRKRAEQYTDDDLLVLAAREVFTGTYRNRKHVLGIGLSESVPDFITLEGAMSVFDAQDAAVLAPHPTFLTVSLSAADLTRFSDQILAAETYNPKLIARQNERATTLADVNEIPPFASSYAHLPKTVSEVWTEFDAEITSESDLVSALRDGVNRRTYHRHGLHHRARCLAEKLHLCYENSWEKIDRLLLSGTEPTHPQHIAYGGEFDDIAVY